MYKIFISHSWAYGDAYDNLLQLLDSHPNFLYQNFSVPKDDPIHNAVNAAQLRYAIAREIEKADAVIILAGVYATYSKWINEEINISKNNFFVSKPIIAVEPWGAEKTSQIVKDSADRIVKWNGDSIVSAIKDVCNGRSRLASLY